MRISSIELETLCRIAELAGQEIMDVYRNGGEAWIKNDASPLTEADLRADQLIRTSLQVHFPGIFILSEESTPQESSNTDTFFLVDPLDGTKEFLKRNNEFTVNIALVSSGRLTAGVVFAPALNELFYAVEGLGSWKRDAAGERPIGTRDFDPSQPLRVIGSRSHGGEKLDAWLAQLDVDHVFVGAGSSLKFCRIAEGRADIYPRFGLTSQWDTAAAQCILEAAGGAVMALSGHPLAYGLTKPILNPEFVAVASEQIFRQVM